MGKYWWYLDLQRRRNQAINFIQRRFAWLGCDTPWRQLNKWLFSSGRVKVIHAGNLKFFQVSVNWWYCLKANVCSPAVNENFCRWQNTWLTSSIFFGDPNGEKHRWRSKAKSRSGSRHLKISSLQMTHRTINERLTDPVWLEVKFFLHLWARQPSQSSWSYDPSTKQEKQKRDFFERLWHRKSNRSGP